MATVNFSVPEEVKKAFNEAYKGQNKSAVIADLMREAVERAQRKQRSREAIARIVERRKFAPAMSDKELHVALEDDQP